MAFAAVMRFWKIKQGQGMRQVDLAARLNRDKAFVSLSLSRPSNWTLRTLGELINAMDGELEISIRDRRESRTDLRGNVSVGDEPDKQMMRAPPLRDRVDKQMLHRLYWNEGLTAQQIATRFGSSPPNVLVLMKKYGIPRRPRHAAKK